MKKLLALSVAVIGLFVNGNSQITLMESNMVKPGTSIAQAYDYSPAAGITPGAAGSGQTWNFAALKAEDPDTFYIVRNTEIPKHQAFPKANMGYYLGTDNDSVWGLMRKDANDFKIIGLVGIDESTGDTIPVDITFQLLTFPSTLGTKFNYRDRFIDSSFALSLDPDGPGPHPTVDSLRTITIRVTDSDIDASGSLTTPFGTFNALRQHLVESFEDSSQMFTNGSWKPLSPLMKTFIGTFFFTASNSYIFWSNQGVGFPLVELSMDTNNSIVEEVFWVEDVPVLGTGIAELFQGNVSIYPNPANDLLKVSLDDWSALPLQFKLIDMRGSLVFEATINLKTQEFDLTPYQKGHYIFSISKGEEAVESGHLILH